MAATARHSKWGRNNFAGAWMVRRGDAQKRMNHHSSDEIRPRFHLLCGPGNVNHPTINSTTQHDGCNYT